MTIRSTLKGIEFRVEFPEFKSNSVVVKEVEGILSFLQQIDDPDDFGLITGILESEDSSNSLLGIQILLGKIFRHRTKYPIKDANLFRDTIKSCLDCWKKNEESERFKNLCEETFPFAKADLYYPKSCWLKLREIWAEMLSPLSYLGMPTFFITKEVGVGYYLNCAGWYAHKNGITVRGKFDHHTTWDKNYGLNSVNGYNKQGPSIQEYIDLIEEVFHKISVQYDILWNFNVKSRFT